MRLGLLLVLAVLETVNGVAPVIGDVLLQNAAAPGTVMPAIGLGVGSYGIVLDNGTVIDGEYWTDAMCADAVTRFLKAGGRRLDTSLAWYHDLKGVGQGMRDSGVNRSDIFVVSKVDFPYDFNQTMEHFEQLLQVLDSDYVDLLLLHWPGAELWNFTSGAIPTWSVDAPPKGQEDCGIGPLCRQRAWAALETIFTSGRARAIGVANFEIRHFEDILELGSLVPSVNQIEHHPYWHQDDLVSYMSAHNVTLNGYAPLGAPDFMNYHRDLWPVLLPEHPTVRAIATQHNVTAANVLAKWSLQKGVLINPRTLSTAHMQENLRVLGSQWFTLSDDEVAQIGDIHQPLRPKVCPDPRIVP